MDFDLFEKLQILTVDKTVEMLIEHTKDKDPVSVHCIILQYFINFLDREYTITEDEIVTAEDPKEMDVLLLNIYESEKFDDPIENYQRTNEFFKCFLESAHTNGLTVAYLASSWLNFLSSVAAHKEIAENRVFKGKAILLLALLLNPLAHLYKTLQGSIADEDIESAAEVLKALHVMIRLTKKGFKYTSFCEPIANEFVEGMETYHDIFGEQSLQLYKNLFLQENNMLHLIGLKSIRKLCYIENIQAQLVEFLLEDDDDSFMSILEELAARKSMRLEVMSLMKAIYALPTDRSILNNNLKQVVYKNIFSANRKIVTATVDLMSTVNDDVWMQVITLLNTADDPDINLLLKTLEAIDDVDCSTANLLKLVLDNLTTPGKSQRAASILTAHLKLNATERAVMLKVFHTTLEHCLSDETTFVVLLDIFTINIDSEDMATFFKQNVKKFESIINSLSEAFIKFASATTLNNIVCALKVLTKVSPQSVLKVVRNIFDQYYNELLKIYQEFVSTKKLKDSFKVTAIKLCVILENRSWNIMSEQTIKIIHSIIRGLAETCSGEESMLAVRLYTNVLKHIWTRLIVGKSIPLKIEKLDVQEFIKECWEFSNEDDFSLDGGYFVLCSFMDLLLMFQPSISQRYDNESLKKVIYVPQKEEIKKVALIVSKLVFADTKEDENTHKREKILTTWITLCKNYENLPGLTASDQIVCHYQLKHQFKGHLEELLKHLLTEKGVFDQTVAFAILNFSNSSDLYNFRIFHHALDEFLEELYSDKNKRVALKMSFCSIILRKLFTHVTFMEDERENRLNVLEYVSIVVKNIDSALKIQLEGFISKELDAFDLTEVEKDCLNAFKASLAH